MTDANEYIKHISFIYQYSNQLISTIYYSCYKYVSLIVAIKLIGNTKIDEAVTDDSCSSIIINYQL